VASRAVAGFLEKILDLADLRMYTAKKSGMNGAVFDRCR